MEVVLLLAGTLYLLSSHQMLESHEAPVPFSLPDCPNDGGQAVPTQGLCMQAQASAVAPQKSLLRYGMREQGRRGQTCAKQLHHVVTWSLARPSHVVFSTSNCNSFTCVCMRQ